MDEVSDSLVALCQLIRRRTHPVRRGEMTPEQFWLLHRLERRGPLSIGRLAEELGVSQSSVTVSCQRLERMGWLRRRRLSSDERVVEVELTGEGGERLASWREARRRLVAELLEPLADGERAELGRLLRRVLAAAGGEEGMGDGTD
ncbi:MAG: MarR family transcriptional regulator [Clostridia bacterium]|nr:MarR family transcriptional regulator [Clostridia bacterium]MCL6522134.1 MarR family transcriptional regulator [Bacillota bacterium]